MEQRKSVWLTLAVLPLLATACNKEDNAETQPGMPSTITVENVLDSQPLVQSGTFENDGAAPVIMPGESVSFGFSAAKGQAVSFATMYGWSSDLFFAPGNPGIMLYEEDGTPIEGDVSSQIKLWDNGTRVNQEPGENVTRPGTAEPGGQAITEVGDMDAQGNLYAPASSLMNVSLVYEGNSMFSITIENISGNTTNPTPFSPGVWAISYIAGGELLNTHPLYEAGQPTANGLTELAEMGDHSNLADYIETQTGIFTPLSPILVVVYNGIENPIYQMGEPDRGEGLKELAQQGDASILADHLSALDGVKEVHVLAAENSTVLLPKAGEQPGGNVSQQLNLQEGDRLAIATMYGFSNDWFFASRGDGIEATQRGDISASIALFDNGTALNQFPGAGITQFNLAGTPLEESENIREVPNPNSFTTLPNITDIIRVTLQ